MCVCTDDIVLNLGSADDSVSYCPLSLAFLHSLLLVETLILKAQRGVVHTSGSHCPSQWSWWDLCNSPVASATVRQRRASSVPHVAPPSLCLRTGTSVTAALGQWGRSSAEPAPGSLLPAVLSPRWEEARQSHSHWQSSVCLMCLFP